MTHIIGIHGPARSGKGTVAKALLDRGGYTQVDFADELRRKLVLLFPMYTSTYTGSTNSGWTLDKAVWDDGCKGHLVCVPNGYRPYIIAKLAEEVGSFLALAFDEWLQTVDYQPTIRQLLQRLGTEVYRKKNSNVWVNTWYDNVCTLRQLGGTYKREDGTVRITDQKTYQGSKYLGGIKSQPQNIVTSDVRFVNETIAIRRQTNHLEARRGFVIELSAPWTEEPKDGLRNHVSNQVLPDHVIDGVIDVPQADWHRTGVKPSLEAYEEWASEIRTKFLAEVDSLITANP